jgi:hypothetical protein
MKNKILALALIAIGLVSCTKDELQPTKAVAKASLDVGIKAEKQQNSATGKYVNRGDLYAWIQDVNITATSLEQTYSTSELFNLVTTGGDSDFHLDNIAVGHNKIDVSTTCSTQPMLVAADGGGTDAVGFMDFWKAKNPYATYSATINNFNIVQGIPNKLENVELTTTNGRIIAVLQLSESLKELGVYASVTPTINGVPFTYYQPFKVSSTNVGFFYWSSTDSVDGNTVGFSWQFYRASDNTLFNPQTFSSAPNLITIIGSKSINKIFTIDNQNLNTNSTSQTSFTAQLWSDGVTESETLTGN